MAKSKPLSLLDLSDADRERLLKEARAQIKAEEDVITARKLYVIRRKDYTDSAIEAFFDTINYPECPGTLYSTEQGRMKASLTTELKALINRILKCKRLIAHPDDKAILSSKSLPIINDDDWNEYQTAFKSILQNLADIIKQ